MARFVACCREPAVRRSASTRSSVLWRGGRGLAGLLFALGDMPWISLPPVPLPEVEGFQIGGWMEQEMVDFAAAVSGGRGVYSQATGGGLMMHVFFRKCDRS